MDDRRSSAGVRRTLSASEQALLGELLRDVGPRLHAYVRRAFPHEVDADEIVAEVFARAAANIAALQQSRRPDLYLLAAARNLCRDAHRRRRPLALGADSLDTAANSAHDPAVQVSDREQRVRMLAAVEALPGALREVVALRLATGLKFEEIAEITGAPLGTVLSRMHQAVGRLRRTLGLEHERVLGK